MLTIALDEAGVFDAGAEAGKGSETPLIGGFIFQGDLDEVELEKKRIKAYYLAVIKECNEEGNKESNKKNEKNKKDKLLEYPECLHVNKDNDKMVGKIKERVKKSLPEYIQTGTYKGKELIREDKKEFPKRQGKYEICAVVKSKEGKKELLKNELGEFFKDGIASNIYFHMASETVSRLVFHNPLYQNETTFNFEIATRESADISREHVEEYAAQGFKMNTAMKNKKEKKVSQAGMADALKIAGCMISEKNHFSLMNADVFRTILTEQMLTDRKKNLSIANFKVESMQYRKKSDEKDKKQEFMYLSDSVVSYLSYNNNGDGDKSVFRETCERANRLTGKNRNLIFAYDCVDVIFEEAWRAVENKQYYDALRIIYELNGLESDEAKYYKKHWKTYIEESIEKDVRTELEETNRVPSAFAKAVETLRNSYLSNTIDTEEAFYIFKRFLRLEDTITDGKVLYEIHDVGVVAYCHRGDPYHAEPHFEKCEQYQTYVDLEEYARTRNRYVTSLYDNFDYENAIQNTRVTLELLGKLVNLSYEVLGSKSPEQFGKKEYGKTLSLAGQGAAFLRHPDALSFFDHAIEVFVNDTANRKITESYRLHYLIEANEKELYEEGISRYLNRKTGVKEQVKELLSMSVKEEINLPYGLYLYLKGLYQFAEQEKTKAVWKLLKEIEEKISIQHKTQHPWELIYKYMALIALRLQDEDKAAEYQELLRKSCKEKKNTLIYAIAQYGELCITKEMNHEEELTEKADKLYAYLVKRFPLFSEEKADTTEEKMQLFQKKFSFMYC